MKFVYIGVNLDNFFSEFKHVAPQWQC